MCICFWTMFFHLGGNFVNGWLQDVYKNAIYTALREFAECPLTILLCNCKLWCCCLLTSYSRSNIALKTVCQYDTIYVAIELIETVDNNISKTVKYSSKNTMIILCIMLCYLRVKIMRLPALRLSTDSCNWSHIFSYKIIK